MCTHVGTEHAQEGEGREGGGGGDTVSTWKIWNAPMHFLFLARSGNESRTSPEVTTDLGTTFSREAARFRVFARNDILSNLFLALRNAGLNIYPLSFPRPLTNGKNRGK